MPACTCLPTGASPPVSGSTTPTLTSWAKAPVDAIVPTANTSGMIRSMRFPLLRNEFAAIYIGSCRQSWLKTWTFRHDATSARRRIRQIPRAQTPQARAEVEDAIEQTYDPPIHASVLRVRLALRIDDLLESAEYPHAGQQLRKGGIRLALLLDRGNEFAVLELDAVHGDVDLGDVDLVVLTVAEDVVKRFEGAVVADIAEEGAERPVVVERERQRQYCAGGHFRDDAHVHGDAELRVDRSLHRIAIGNRPPCLVLEQVDGMGSVMPEQVIGPAARIARCIDVPAAEEIGLCVHLLDRELALLDALVDPLMARVEAAHVPAHRHDARFFRDLGQLLGVLDAVGDRDFHQHVLAGAHHLLALPKMQLRRRGQDHRVGALDAFRELAGIVGDTVFLRDFGGGVLIAADQRADLDVGNALERVEMFLAERPLAGDADLHHRPVLAMR